MKNTWVLSIRTSLPEVCESHGNLQTSIYAFESFEEARAALRKALKKYAFSKNSMFDGRGHIVHFLKYFDDPSLIDWDGEEIYYDGDYLDLTNLDAMESSIHQIFEGKDVVPKIKEGFYTDYTIAYTYENGEVSFRGYGDGPCNGYTPVLTTNMFSMEAPQHYYMYIDDVFGQDAASSELYIDLIRAREFNENSLFTDMTQESANAAFAADMKDMLQDLIDMGDDEELSIEDNIRSALRGEYGTRELPDVGTAVDDIYTVIRCPVCYNKTLNNSYICCHCGWEHDDFLEDHYSAANGSTLLEYREAYNKIAAEMAASLLQKMYFITCFSNFESEYIDNHRTFGYFSDTDTCREALNENWADMCEAGYYTYAVIEEISEGIHSHAKQIAWFCWDEERKGFYETEKPEWSNGWYGFALG